MNQQQHWNNVAGTYDDEVFDVFKENKGKKLQRYIKKHVLAHHEVVDLGCGIGKAFKYLAPVSKSVLAIDISDACLVEARKNRFKNIHYQQADLTRPLSIKPVDFALCCNVAILPQPDQSYKIIQTVSRSLKKRGVAIVVVPSLESSLYASWRMIQWYKKEGVIPDDIPGEDLAYFDGAKTNWLQGIVSINDVQTKHYTAEELQVVFADAGLKITALEKLEYKWTTEFADPPAWIKAPFPWDWLIECEKR